MDKSTCSTGISANTPNVYFCPADYPRGTFANGAGALCFADLADCLAGPNSCDPAVPCQRDAACATGQATGAGAPWSCALTTPPHSLANGAGAYCYLDGPSCANGPNGCDARTCQPDPVSCATGQAASMGHLYFCNQTVPAGVSVNGAGIYVYPTLSACYDGCVKWRGKCLRALTHHQAQPLRSRGRALPVRLGCGRDGAEQSDCESRGVPTGCPPRCGLQRGRPALLKLNRHLVRLMWLRARACT